MSIFLQGLKHKLRFSGTGQGIEKETLALNEAMTGVVLEKVMNAGMSTGRP